MMFVRTRLKVGWGLTTHVEITRSVGFNMLNVYEDTCCQGYYAGMGCSICALENRLYSPLIELIESQVTDDTVVCRCIIDACAAVNEANGNKEDLLIILKNVLLLAVAAIRSELNDQVMRIMGTARACHA